MGNQNTSLSTLLVAALLIGFCAGGADAAEKPANVAEIPGSDVKRIVLTAKASERLGIETAPVREEPVQRWLSFQGEVEIGAEDIPVQGAALPNNLPLRVRVPVLDPSQNVTPAIPLISLGREEQQIEDRAGVSSVSQPSSVTVLPKGVAGRVSRIRATLAQGAPATNGAGAARSVYYVLDPEQAGLVPGQHVYVRIPQRSSGTSKVIPYSAVIYDRRGRAWVYTNPEPLSYVRHGIDLEYVQGDIAVLRDGPAPGTQVVNVGAAALMSVEEKVAH